MRIIDIHSHVYPENIAWKAADSVRDFYEIRGDEMQGTAQELLERGRAAGISQYAILPVAIRPERVSGINDFSKKQASQHPEFIACGTIHAAMDDIEAETQRILDMDLRAVKMHPDTQIFPIDDIRLYPFYDAIQGRIPVIFHMGDHRYNYSHPVRLYKLMLQFPRLQVVAAHFGGYRMHAEALDVLKDTGCFLDISSTMMFMQPGEAERYIHFYGAERMAYGTDYPLWDPVTQVERFLQLKLTSEQLETIAWKTAHHLLNLKNPPC